MNKNTIVGIIVVVIVILAGVLGWYYNTKTKNNYSIVYLSTGEVYVGKLSTFPDLRLKDAYILLVTQDPADKTKNNFQLNPIAEALWAPEYLQLTKENVVFHGPLLKTSKIAETLSAR